MPGKVSGAWLFKDTRVPVRPLFGNLEDGATAKDFLAWFPGAAHAQAVALLERAEPCLGIARKRNTLVVLDRRLEGTRNAERHAQTHLA